MSKGNINRLSKRQILESLHYEQSQGLTTLSRLVTAIARQLKLDPSDLATAFADDKANQDYIEQFNQQVRQQHAAQPHNHDHTDHDHSHDHSDHDHAEPIAADSAQA